jgi:glycosyltransferase involved in cell wall biosynthesis
MAQTQRADAGLTATIVVLTHNRREALAACLSKISENTMDVRYEVIVVDNGSSDGSAALAQSRGLFTFALPTNEGVCARNHALRDARGNFILQVDDDVLVGPGWAKALLAPFSDPKVGAVGQEGFFINWAGLMAGPWTAPNFLHDLRPSPGEYCDLVMGYCWAWRNIIGHRESETPHLWHQEPVFLYDERFNPHWHEETDLQLQIKAAGYRIRCGPAVARHRSLKDPAAARNNDPMVGLQHAADHERLLIEKWADKRELVGLELDRRGQGS